MQSLEDLIPHQLKLSQAQIAKMLQGLTTAIPYKSLGADKGEQVIHLLADNAEKMMNAYKSGKGARIKMRPVEIGHTIQSGRGIEDIFNSPIAQKIIDKVIDKGLSWALGGKIVGPKGMRGAGPFEDFTSGAEKFFTSGPVKKIGEKILEKGIDRLLGGKVAKGSEEAKARMKALRDLRGKGKGVKGAGQFEDMFNNLGRAVTQTWNQPPRSAFERDAANFLNQNLIGGIPTIVGRIAGPEAEEIARMPVGAYLDERRRVDNQGRGVANSRMYKKAMKSQTGVVPSVQVANKPVSAFVVDKRVKPSGDQMTLSPYQAPSAPAMNPFVPKTYTQEGGTQSGYGGRGLY